ncbi:hypothetical protein F2Q69_00053095 [Brassica cretica]|uniref:Uncharacterized protein n=1 Tax=Brassica cretica TaxID=69181 RepID=A0A8S9MZ85_BRACR|nr:hypothetical protein F2Q69_00053095 [Brassica cretica]
MYHQTPSEQAVDYSAFRPPRISEMSVEELDANEKQAFLNWRRMFVRLEENEKLVLTPFEKNLDIWRQLWRVLERGDLIVMVVDARDVLVPALQKRDIIARAKTGTAKTVTGNTTLDVKAERAEDVLTHQRYMLRPRRKWELKTCLCDEDFSKVTEVRFSLVDGTGGIDYKRRVNESFDTREMESRWNLCASQLSGCSLNAEEFVISKLGLPRDVIVPALQKRDIIARAKA